MSDLSFREAATAEEAVSLFFANCVTFSASAESFKDQIIQAIELFVSAKLVSVGTTLRICEITFATGEGNSQNSYALSGPTELVEFFRSMRLLGGVYLSPTTTDGRCRRDNEYILHISKKCVVFGGELVWALPEDAVSERLEDR